MAAKPYIPASPTDLSPGWVTEALRVQGSLASDRHVTGLDVSRLDGGIGLAGDVVRVALRYGGPSDSGGPSDTGTAAGEPATVVAKFPNPNPTDRAIVESQGVYEREIMFYRDIAPRLPFAIPKLFGAAMDPGPSHAMVGWAAAGIDRLPARAHSAIGRNTERMLRPTKRRYALLIEDLGDQRRVYTLNDPPPVEKLQLALTSLAELHAHFWGQDDLAKHPACWPIVTETPLLQRNLYRDLAPVAADRYQLAGGPMQAVCDEAGERFCGDVAWLNRPITLTHTDPRSDNFLFDPASDGLTIVDWAMPGFADPGYDVGYLLSSSLDAELGRPTARSLVDHYHRALKSHGVHHPVDDLWRSVEAAARVAVVQQTLALSMFRAGNASASPAGGGLGTEPHPADQWLPRALAILHTG